MKKFEVEITETLQRTVTVEAASQEEAERMVDRGWRDGDYVLTDEDYVGVSMGMTIQNVTRADYIIEEPVHCTFVPILGGVG